MARKALPQVGKRTTQVAGLDEREAAGSDAMVEAARTLKATREAKGNGDSYQQRQGYNYACFRDIAREAGGGCVSL